MTKFAMFALIAAALATPAGATTHESPRAGPAPLVAAAADAAMSEGEVRKVDPAAKKITIKHGELRNLDMPPMTMVFQVADPALLKQVKPGDKVRFRAEKISGAFTVIELQSVQ